MFEQTTMRHDSVLYPTTVEIHRKTYHHTNFDNSVNVKVLGYGRLAGVEFKRLIGLVTVLGEAI
jgi:hypothetical protein